MKLKLGNEFLDQGDLKELGIWKSVGEHSRLIAAIDYAEADLLDDFSDLIGMNITCRFDDGDVQTDLFGGVVTSVEFVMTDAEGRPRMVHVTAFSDSIRADLVPCNRVFQNRDATLGTIVDKVLGSTIASAERKRGDFSLPVPLSVQFEETDFQYLSRLLGADGIPIVVDDVNGRFYAGNPEAASHSLEDRDIIGDVFVGRIAPLLSGESFAASRGRLGELQNAIARFADSLEDRSQYFTSSVHAGPKKRQQEALSIFDMADYSSQAAQQKIRTKRIFMAIGDRVQVGQAGSYTVRDSVFRFSMGGSNMSSFDQQYSLVGAQELCQVNTNIARNHSQDLSKQDWVQNGYISWGSPVSSQTQAEVPWHSRIFVAEVTKNEGDPDDLGRMQVRFDWESQGQEESKQCWADVLTPFAGNAADKTCGFLMLPEVGEKVLVRFIEPWDDKPVVIGSLRRGAVTESLDTAKYKVIRTPGGNCIDLISDKGKETVRLRAGKADRFHLVVETSGGSTKVSLECNDSMLIKGQDIRIKGETVSIESQSSFKIEAGADLLLKSTAGTEMKSPATVKIKGSLIELN